MADEIIQGLFEHFGQAVDIGNDENGLNEIRRIEILSELRQLTHFAVQGNFVLVRTNLGRCLIEKREIEGAPMVGFVYKGHRTPTSEAFWYNQSSVVELGQMLRDNPTKKVSMQSLAQI